MNKKIGLILTMQSVIALGADDFLPGFKKGFFSNGFSESQSNTTVKSVNNSNSTMSWTETFYTDIGPITRTFDGRTQCCNMNVGGLHSAKGSMINGFQFNADLILNSQLTREEYMQNILQSGLNILQYDQ